MVNYAQSVLYKIMSLDPEIDDIYVGSTTAFRKRKHDHKSDCNNEKSEKHNRYVYHFIRNNCGWDNWSMVVVKAYPDITSKMELLNKERKWMKKLNATLNQTVPGITLELGKTEYSKQYYKEYNKLNTEHVKQRCKQYRELNKNKVTEYKKHYQKLNKDKITEYNKQRYDKNKNKILEKIKCECGCMTSRNHIERHRKSKKHMELMNE